MKRIIITGCLAGVVFLIARKQAPELHEQVMAHCEGMFDHMTRGADAERGTGSGPVVGEGRAGPLSCCDVHSTEAV